MFGNSFPFLVIGVSVLVAGIMCSVLPETRNKRLADTMEEVKNREKTATFINNTEDANDDEDRQVILIDEVNNK